MIIVRIFPKGDLEDTWNKVLGDLEKISDDYCTPLYLSRQEEKNFMSIIYDVKDIDIFGNILVKNIPSALQPEKTRTITLLRPVFFPVRKDRPKNLERYQVAVRAKSNELENVFTHVIDFSYPRDVFPTYAAYSFGEDDILTSMLSVSISRIEQFVLANIESQKGVTGVDVARINMSKRLANAEMWKKYRESRYLFKPTKDYEEYDFAELTALTGAIVGEVKADI